MLPFLMMKNAAAGAGPGDPPSGAPTLASVYLYGGSFVGVQWSNTDVTAATAVSKTVSAAVEPGSTIDYLADAGETTFETGETDTEHWWVAHYKNGQLSAWAYAPYGE